MALYTGLASVSAGNITINRPSLGSNAEIGWDLSGVDPTWVINSVTSYFQISGTCSADMTIGLNDQFSGTGSTVFHSGVIQQVGISWPSANFHFVTDHAGDADWHTNPTIGGNCFWAIGINFPFPAAFGLLGQPVRIEIDYVGVPSSGPPPGGGVGAGPPTDGGGAGGPGGGPPSPPPLFAISTLPTIPETWWIVCEGYNVWQVYKAACLIIDAKLPGDPGTDGAWEREDELSDILVVSYQVAVQYVGQDLMNAFLGN